MDVPLLGASKKRDLLPCLEAKTNYPFSLQNEIKKKIVCAVHPMSLQLKIAKSVSHSRNNEKKCTFLDKGRDTKS